MHSVSPLPCSLFLGAQVDFILAGVACENTPGYLKRLFHNLFLMDIKPRAPSACHFDISRL